MYNNHHVFNKRDKWVYSNLVVFFAENQVVNYEVVLDADKESHRTGRRYKNHPLWTKG